MILGPGILDIAGRQLDVDEDGTPGESPDDQYTATFTITAPWVTGYSPSGTTVPLVGSLRLAFDRAMEPSSFSLAEDIVGVTAPPGP